MRRFCAASAWPSVRRLAWLVFAIRDSGRFQRGHGRWLRHRSCGIECLEDVLGIAGAVAALRASQGRTRLVEHVSACRLGSLVMGVDVVDRDIDPASASVAAMKILGPLRLYEDHPVAVGQGRVVGTGCTAGVLAEDPGLQPECALQPDKRGRDVGVAFSASQCGPRPAWRALCDGTIEVWVMAGLRSGCCRITA